MQTTKPRGTEEGAGRKPGAGRSKLKLALGAAGLLLFIVGIKRSFHPEEAIGDDASQGRESGGDGAGAGA